MVVAVIPARYGSRRFPGKPLCLIKGKPMIEHVFSRVKKARFIDDVFVATDNRDIFRIVEGFGGKAVMTSRDHASGTDRVAEAVRGLRCRFIINVQGDEPLIPPRSLDRLVRNGNGISDNEILSIVTPIRDGKEFNNPNVVKVVISRNFKALYFSRAAIPYGSCPCYRHVGVYFYSKRCLESFVKMRPSPLERSEKLEQLRALENGIEIKINIEKYMPPDVNTPSDIRTIEKLMQ